MSPSTDRALDLVFMGSAGFAVPALEALHASRHRVRRVYSQPARPAGRGLAPRRAPVHAAAERLGIPVLTPKSLRDAEVQAQFRALDADLAVVGAYGLLLPPPILDAPTLGCINLHASLLPRWRGAAPIQHAILAGDAVSGISIFRMEPGLDTGPVLAMERVALAPGTTAAALHDRLAALAAGMIGPVVDALADGRATARPQPDEGVTYAPKLGREDGRLDWQRPAEVLERQVRAFTPWPGCWTTLDGERLRVLAAALAGGSGPPGEVLDDRLTVACGAGALRLTTLQRAGGRPLAAEDFLRGFRVPAGARLH